MRMPASEGHLAIRATHLIGGQLIVSLRKRIVRSALVPGRRLSEQEIARSYGMSRQPVRKAFIRLAGEGLLEVHPLRGTFVRKIPTEEVEILRFFHEAVEADLVRPAATEAGDRNAANLREQIDRQARVADQGADRIPLDERFYRSLAEIAGRAGARPHLQAFKVHMDRVRYLTAAEFPVSRLIAEHRRVFEAITARGSGRGGGLPPPPPEGRARGSAIDRRGANGLLRHRAGFSGLSILPEGRTT